MARSAATGGHGTSRSGLAEVATVEQEVERLYGLPLEEFTGARNDAAARLRKNGDTEGAARLKQLEKPTVAAWAVNQLARRHSDQVSEALAAGRDVRKAHRAALRGGGGEELAEASRREREVVSRLVRSAGAVLEDAGRKATGQTLDKIRATLHAATLDLEAGKALEAGTLTGDLEPAGFGPLLSAVPSSAARPRPRKGEGRREKRREAQAALTGARSEERELRKIARAAERDARQAAERAESAAEKADEAAARVAELERLLESLRG